MYKLLALDLDGTLTNSKKEITSHTIDTLLQAQEKGLRIILASGRPIEGILPLAEQLQLQKYNGYIMAFNGGLIIECATGRTIYKKTIPPSVYPYLYAKAKEYGFPLVSYLNGAIASEDIENEYVRYEAMLNRMPLKKLDNFLEEITFPEPKCLIVGNPERLAVLEKEMKTDLEGKLSVYRSESFFLELPPLGIDKAKCLEILLKEANCEREDLMACGDGFNDLSMIQYAGLGIAMENAQPAVKEVADYVTSSNEEDGVAAAVEKFYLKDFS